MFEFRINQNFVEIYAEGYCTSIVNATQYFAIKRKNTILVENVELKIR